MKLNLSHLLTLLLLTGILGLSNFLSTRHFQRVDLTGRYTLSDATRSILADVDDVITVKAYFSQEFPPALLSMRRDIEDLLAEVEAEGRGLVTVEYLDPSEDQELAEELEKLGIGPDPVQILEEDQVQAVNVYKSIVLYHADQKEAIPSLIGVQDLEYKLAVAIKKLSLRELPTVAFLGFKDGPSTFTELADLSRELKTLYDVDTAVVTGGKLIADDIKTLIAIRPKNLSPAEAYQIDQFLMRGGRAIFLIDGMEVDMSQDPPRPETVESGLEEMLASYGVTVDKQLLFDRSCETVTVQVRQGVRMPSRYPPFVTAVFQFFNHDSPLVSGISKIPFPWVSPLSVNPSALAGREVTELIRSTDEAWIPRPIELSPNRIRPPRDPGQVGSRLLAAALVGTFESAWKDRELPEPAPTPGSQDERPPHRDSGKTRIVVVGDADFALPSFRTPGGLRFLFNAVDWLTLDDSLIEIRTEAERAKPLPQMDTAEKRWFRVVNIALAPLLATLFGLARFFYRRRRQAGGSS